MLVQQAAFVGWMALRLDQLATIDTDIRVRHWRCVAGMYWYVMGTMLTAERPEMSQRVRRRLPQSFLGRMFFTWLNPGPASGYMFVVANAHVRSSSLYLRRSRSAIWDTATAIAGRARELLLPAGHRLGLPRGLSRPRAAGHRRAAAGRRW